MTDKPEDYRGAEPGDDGYNVTRLTQTLDQTQISDRYHGQEHPRTPDIGSEAYGAEDELSPDPDADYVHDGPSYAGPSLYGAYQQYGDEDPMQEYDEGEFPHEYDGAEYPPDHFGDHQYPQDYDDYGEYTHDDGPHGPVDPLAYDPHFHLDPMYQIHDDKDWVVGAIVMLYWAEPKGHSIPKQKHGATTLYNLGDMAYQSIRRMVVLSTDNGSSFCCPISTYGGQGCNKKRCQPEKHGIIHDAAERPQTLPDERRLGVEPVGAEMYGGHTLSKASRLNYGTGHSVQHNLPVVFVGQIPRGAMKGVKSACQRFLLGPSDDDTDKPKNPKHPKHGHENKHGKTKNKPIYGDGNEAKKGRKDGSRDKKDCTRSKPRHSKH